MVGDLLHVIGGVGFSARRQVCSDCGRSAPSGGLTLSAALPSFAGSAARRAPPPVTKKLLPDGLAVFWDCGCSKPGQSLASRACLADQTGNVGRRATSGGTHCRKNTEHRAFGLALFHLFSDLLLAEAKNAATNGCCSRSDRNCNTEKRG